MKPAKRVPEVARRDWAVAVLAAAGLGVSAYLTYTKLASATALFCEAGGACDLVQASRYATFLGLPTAAWGAGLWAALGALALAGLPVRRWRWAFVLAVVGASFSLYLIYLQIFVLRAYCVWCLADAAIAFALLGVLVARRPAATGRRSPMRPARLLVTGGATAVITVVLAVAANVAESPGELAAGQEALARHLRASGAVFFGAFW